MWRIRKNRKISFEIGEKVFIKCHKYKGLAQVFMEDRNRLNCFFVIYSNVDQYPFRLFDTVCLSIPSKYIYSINKKRILIEKVYKKIDIHILDVLEILCDMCAYKVGYSFFNSLKFRLFDKSIFPGCLPMSQCLFFSMCKDE